MRVHPPPSNSVRVMTCERQGNLVQHTIVSQCWFKLLESNTKQFVLSIFKHSITLGKGVLATIISIP